MKKVLAFLLTAIMAVTALTAVAANPSPEKLSGVIVSASAKDSAGKGFKVAIKPTAVAESVYNDALADLKTSEGTDLKIVDQKQVVLEGSGNPAFPMTVEFSVPGVKTSSKVFILFKNNAGAVAKLSATAGDGKVTATFNELGEFVLVTDAQTVTDITVAKDDTKSPQTSDAATPIVFTLLAVSAIAAVVSVKKIRVAE